MPHGWNHWRWRRFGPPTSPWSPPRPAGRHPLSRERTASFAYVRLHGSTQLYASRYTDQELAKWAAEIAAWQSDGSDVYVYFDNDAEGHAPRDALRLSALLERIDA